VIGDDDSDCDHGSRIVIGESQGIVMVSTSHSLDVLCIGDASLGPCGSVSPLHHVGVLAVMPLPEEELAVVVPALLFLFLPGGAMVREIEFGS
jgi:hypothetical protein